MPRFIPRALRGQVPSRGGQARQQGRTGGSSRPARRRPDDDNDESVDTGRHARTNGTESRDAGLSTDTVSMPAVTSDAADSGSTADSAVTTPRRPSPRPHGDRPSPRPKTADGSAAEGDDESATGTRPRVKAPVRPSGGRPARDGAGGRRSGRSGGDGRSKGRSQRSRVEAERRDRQRLRVLRVTATGLLTLTLLVVAGTIWLWRVSDTADATSAARTGAAAVAQAAAPAILSYDYRSYDASVARGKGYTGGTFAKQYAASTHDLKASATKEKAVVRATVSATGVVSATPNKVVLLLYVNQYRQNSNIDGQKVDQNRVVMTMSRSDDTWKVTKVVAA